MTTTDDDALRRVVVAARDGLSAADPTVASIDDLFLDAVLAAEAAHPDNADAASRAIEAALDELLERLGPANDDEAEATDEDAGEVAGEDAEAGA